MGDSIFMSPMLGCIEYVNIDDLPPKTDKDPQARMCGICYTDYSSDPGPLNEEPVKVLCPAGHIFGGKCIIAWIQSSTAQNRQCPYCRSLIRYSKELHEANTADLATKFFIDVSAFEAGTAESYRDLNVMGDAINITQLVYAELCTSGQLSRFGGSYDDLWGWYSGNGIHTALRQYISRTLFSDGDMPGNFANLPEELTKDDWLATWTEDFVDILQAKLLYSPSLDNGGQVRNFISDTIKRTLHLYSIVARRELWSNWREKFWESQEEESYDGEGEVPSGSSEESDRGSESVSDYGDDEMTDVELEPEDVEGEDMELDAAQPERAEPERAEAEGDEPRAENTEDSVEELTDLTAEDWEALFA